METNKLIIVTDGARKTGPCWTISSLGIPPRKLLPPSVNRIEHFLIRHSLNIMSSVDEIFQKSRQSIPVSTKRKLEDPTSTASYRSQPHKSPKFANGTSPHSSRLQRHINPEPEVIRTATVEDEPPSDDDIEAGPSMPPGGVEDELGDDEEGRFFGGGITKQGQQALDFLNESENADGDAQKEEVYDTAWLRRTAVSLQKKIDKNAEMRARYADQPQKFIQSEADLDDDLKGLSILSEHTELYSGFANISEGGVESVVSLLGHENTDIAMRAVQVLVELTDEDTEADESQWKTLVQALLTAGVMELLVSNLDRLEEISEESDREGVYRVLELVENLCSDPSIIEKIGSQEGFLPWLLTRIQKRDADVRTQVSQNRQYAAELLAILLQGSIVLRRKFAALDGVDTLLQLLSVYRKRDPERDSEEEEFVENLFDCLTCLVDDREGAEKYLEGEGVELCLIMLREGKMSKLRALKVLDHALGGENAIAVCEKLVDAAGLKTVFGMFMKKQQHHEQKGEGRGENREVMEHFIGIFASLLRHLPAESAARIRTLAKFVEKDYEKIGRLIEFRRECATRLAQVDREIDEEKKVIDAEEYEVMESEWFSRRLDAGLFARQTIDVILSWLVAEDAGASNRVSRLLGGGFQDIVESLEEQLYDMDVDAEGHSRKEILETLLRCVKAS